MVEALGGICYIPETDMYATMSSPVMLCTFILLYLCLTEESSLLMSSLHVKINPLCAGSEPVG
jgi:hypothetical protein